MRNVSCRMSCILNYVIMQMSLFDVVARHEAR